MHLVDQIGLEELSNSADAATDPDVEVTGKGAGLRERGDGVGVHEMERRPTLHLEHRPGMVRQYDHRGVEDRVLAPPPLPSVVLPGAALRAELVAAHDLHADPRFPPAGERVVDP